MGFYKKWKGSLCCPYRIIKCLKFGMLTSITIWHHQSIISRFHMGDILPVFFIWLTWLIVTLPLSISRDSELISMPTRYPSPSLGSLPYVGLINPPFPRATSTPPSMHPGAAPPKGGGTLGVIYPHLYLFKCFYCIDPPPTFQCINPTPSNPGAALACALA